MKHTSPYKTAAELGITEWERDGLIALIGPMERGELGLDMETAGHETKCGTIACIGGWLALNEGRNSLDYVAADFSHALYPLFYPGETGGYDASPQQAARAIVNFLTIGEPRWREVMAGA